MPNEKRAGRYRLDIPALFSWKNAQHWRPLYAEGITRDISVLGAFIVTATCPPVETQVEVEVVLPSLHGKKSVVRIKGQARVIRVEHRCGDRGENGFAVVREASNRPGAWRSIGTCPRAFQLNIQDITGKTIIQ